MSINENKVDEDIFEKAKNRLASFICEVRSANGKNLATWSRGYYPRDGMIKSALS